MWCLIQICHSTWKKHTQGRELSHMGSRSRSCFGQIAITGAQSCCFPSSSCCLLKQNRSRHRFLEPGTIDLETIWGCQKPHRRTGMMRARRHNPKQEWYSSIIHFLQGWLGSLRLIDLQLARWIDSMSSHWHIIYLRLGRLLRDLLVGRQNHLHHIGQIHLF